MILIFFLAVFFTLFSAFLISGKPLALGFSGLVLGVSVLMKVAAFYFPFMLMILLFFTSKQNWQLWFKRIIIFIIPFALPLLAFMIHNKIVFNQFKLTYIDSFNLCAFFYSQVLAYDHGTNWGIEIEQLAKQYKTEGQHFDGIKQQFWRDFFSRPHTFIFMWLRNVFKICAGLYSTNLKILTNNNIHGRELSYFNMHGNIWQKATAYIAACTPYRWVKIVAWLEVVWSIIRYILCCLGLLFLWHIKRYWLSLFFLAYIFYFSFMIACDGTARYRFFFEFVLIILAALGIQVVINWLVSKQTTSFKRTV
jgi:4-amino-4-deoxy-L-arabinose transferase-like glycosyltransferase